MGNVRSLQNAGKPKIMGEIRDYTLNTELVAQWAANNIASGYMVSTEVVSPAAKDGPRHIYGVAFEQ